MAPRPLRARHARAPVITLYAIALSKLTQRSLKSRGTLASGMAMEVGHTPASIGANLTRGTLITSGTLESWPTMTNGFVLHHDACGIVAAFGVARVDFASLAFEALPTAAFEDGLGIL